MVDGKPFDLKRHLPSTAFVALALVLLGAFGALFIYLGVYNIGADAPHWGFVYNGLETLRDRAITHHARDIKPPADLNSAERIRSGAGLYAEMCSGCHLGPGAEKSEMSQGLYPQAPELALGSDRTPAEQFWTIKHGVKLSAMPAWGKTHNDKLIWDMVAFVQQLPKMTPEQYQAALGSAPASHDEMMKQMMPHSASEPAAHDTASKPHAHGTSESSPHGH